MTKDKKTFILYLNSLYSIFSKYKGIIFVMNRERIFSIPNILSFFRIILIPFIVWQFFIDNDSIAIGLIALSALTDVVDGYIARRFNMITSLGKALDPIADKATLVTLIACLCLKIRAMVSLLVVFVIKEIIMGIEGILVIKKTGTTYSAKWFGKASTASLYLTIVLNVWWKNMPVKLSNFLIVLCQGLAILSLVLYTIHNSKIMKNEDLCEDTQVERG